MEQFEQLLTCAICLDRYRNPKLLPCQHSFCMEPCMDGLVDYVRRQVKCPECRAEHRIPYQGVQAFPTNVTLQRFLELHIEITGELPDPTSGQTMERCGVCSEKSYCSLCVHCDKKCCPECKDAHMDILRREITRINSQIRRGLHRLQDALALVEKNTLSLQTNCASVAEEVDEIYRRLSKALKDRTEHLRNEIDRYSGTELRLLIQLKENLELEIANIQSNCDLAEAHINENVPWDDAELLDTKELFLRTVEFIRNYEYELGDYGRRVRFVMAHDPNQLVLHVAGYGELNIKPETGSTGHLGTTGGLAPSGGSPGLMRSKSDHRLASQYRQEEERLSRNRYVPDYEYDTPDYEAPRNKSRYRSRFMRQRDGEESDGDTRSGSVRFSSSAEQTPREKVLYTEDAARGPISGIFRLTDSPRVMKKLQECERASKRKKDDPAVVTPIAAAPTQTQPPKTTQVQPKKSPAPAKQTSEDDEISRIKKQNKANPKPQVEVPDPTPTPVAREPEPEDRRPAIARRTSSETHTPGVRSASSDSSTGSESSTGSGIRSTGATFTAEEMKQKYLSKAPPQTTNTNSVAATNPTRDTAATTTTTTPRPFQSRFLGNRATPPAPSPATVPEKKKEEEEDDDTSSSSEETETETEESETDTRTSSAPATSERREVAMAKTDIGPLLARSAEARRGSKEESPSTRYSSPRGSPALSTSSPTGTSSPSGYTSRFVAIAHDNHDLSSNSVNTLDDYSRSVIRKNSDDALLFIGDNNSVDNNESASNINNNSNNNNNNNNNYNNLTGEKILASNEHYSSVPSIVITPDDNKLISVNHPDPTVSIQQNINNININNGTDNIKLDLTHDLFDNYQSDSASNQPEALTIRSYELNKMADGSESQDGGNWMLGSIKEEVNEDLPVGKDIEVSSDELESEESDYEMSDVKAGSHDLDTQNGRNEIINREIEVGKTNNGELNSESASDYDMDDVKADFHDLEVNNEEIDVFNANNDELHSESDSDDEMDGVKADFHELGVNNEKIDVLRTNNGESASNNEKMVNGKVNNGISQRLESNEINHRKMASNGFEEEIGSKLNGKNYSNELDGTNNKNDGTLVVNGKRITHEIPDETFENGQTRKMSPESLEAEVEVSEGIMTDTEDLGEILSSVIKSAKKMEQEYSLKHNPRESETESESELESDNPRTLSKSIDSASEMSASFSTNQSVSDRIDDIFNRNSISEDLFDEQGWIVAEEDLNPPSLKSPSLNSNSSKTDFFTDRNLDVEVEWNSIVPNEKNGIMSPELTNHENGNQKNNGWLRNNNYEQSSSSQQDGVTNEEQDGATNNNLNNENDSRMDNRNIPMQMVTTVFCVSVLCYGVLTNLFL